jgi:hypothetical protein
MPGLELEVRYRTAAQPALMQRVAMAATDVAFTMLSPGSPPLTAGTNQSQRSALVRQILENPLTGADVLARFIVSDETISDTAILDAQITARVTVPVLDGLAALLFPDLT